MVNYIVKRQAERKHARLTCMTDTSAGLELLGQNFADLIHPGGFNLCCRSLEDIVAKHNSIFVNVWMLYRKTMK